MKFAEVEAKYNVTFPKKWHEIYDTGAMEWTELSHEEFKADRDRYINDPKAFMMWDADCEPLFAEDIESRKAEIDEWIEWKSSSEQDFSLKDGIKLIPFAMMGTGDLYCFLYDGEGEPQVVLVLHDDCSDPEIIGKDFDEFMYNMMLCAASWDEDIEGETWKEHMKYLPDEYREKLAGRDADDLSDEIDNARFPKASLGK